MNLPKFYLDTRAIRADGTFPLKLNVRHNGQKILISLNVYPTEKQWEFNTVVKHPNAKMINFFI